MKKIRLESRQSLKTKKILIIGAKSTLAVEFLKIIDNSSFKILKISRKNLNFNQSYNPNKLKILLDRFKPDFILNFVGINMQIKLF